MITNNKEQFEIDSELERISEETGEKILDNLNASTKLDAIINQLNMLTANEIDRGTASDEMLAVANTVTKIRKEGKKEKENVLKNKYIET